MKLGIKTFLIISMAGLAIVLSSVFAMMKFQSIRIEKQLQIVENSLQNVLDSHPELNSQEKKSLSREITEKLRQGAKKNFMMVMIFVAITIVICSSIAYLVIYSITSKLKEMVTATGSIRGGDYTTRLGIERKDELGDLSSSIDTMAEAIMVRDEELRTTNVELAELNTQLENEIEERRKKATLLQESEERLKTILYSMHAGIALIDAETRIVVDINPASSAMIGLSKEEIVGSECCRFFCATKKTEICPILDEDLTLDNSERVLIKANGEILPVLKTAVPVILDGRKHLLESMLDLSKLKEAEAENKKLQNQLAQTQKIEAIGTLAGGIAHDFNNLLSPIMGNAELTMMQVPKDGKAQHYLENILSASIRAQNLVQQILTFSRQKEQEKIPLQIQSIVKEVLKLLRSSLPPTIEIKQNIDMNCGSILADPTQIHQVIMNLCTNAYHAMEETGGILEVALTCLTLTSKDTPFSSDLSPGSYVKLTVSDTGQGIPPEIQERIFEPFFTTKREGKGTGMGLSVAHGIVNEYGGHISVKSEPDKGSLFEIYLPATSKTPAEISAIIPEQIPRGTERILLVDDEEQITQTNQEILNLFGYDVKALTSSPEALEIFRSNPADFDLVITDQTMPIMPGTELATELLRIRPDISIILITGFSSSVNREHVLKMGIKKFLLKPIAMRKLALTVREVLDNP